jgi:ATP-binding cassette, subfamily B, multidrug efflux pump
MPTSPHPDEETFGKAYDGRLVRRLLHYIRPYMNTVAVAMVMLGLLTLLELAGPAIVKQAIDDAIAHGALNRLDVYALEYLLVVCGIFGLRFGQNYLLNRAGQLAMHDLRVELFAHIQRLSLTFFDRNPVGRLMTRLTNDVDALNELLTSGGLAIVSDAVTIVGIAIALLLINWPLALMTFVVIPPLLVLTHFIRLGMRESFRAVRIRLARVNAMIAENISGIPVIQLFNRERAAYDQFDAANTDLLRAHLKGVLYFALFWPLVGVASAMTIAGIVWYGGAQVMAGGLSVGGVVAFFYYVDRFFQPIRDLSEKYNIMQQAMASSERIFLILDERPSVKDPAQPVEIPRLRGDIEFRDVWFAYEPGNWVLKGVSFHIREGERVAIVGATGAGKTSIISLVSRFYDVQKGQVLVDGIDVRDLRQVDLRRQVGVVLQDPFLFTGTIDHNIRLNDARISDEQVRQAARYVDADAFIQALPGGYQAAVRERGAGLSVGQKQLIAFARAVAFNPAMLLVLDEATANVDTETEWRIQRALERLMRNRTSIVIAHRLSTIRQVDRILVLHKGRLVEEGSHEELLRVNGLYARLYELQYRDQEAAPPLEVERDPQTA